jgi:predicted transglutaminase-like cysteine proteinase
MRAVPRFNVWLLACMVLAWCVGYAAPRWDVLQATIYERWGTAALSKYVAWRDLISAGAVGTEQERLKRVNDFFNRTVTFMEDSLAWGQSDYWATPLETLGRSAGDCEDFVIAKYFTLQLVGVAQDRMRLVYVYARTGNAQSVPAQAHMVLAYYPSPDVEPLVLDNLIADIRPASRRPDLSPVFSFNSQGIFQGATGAMVAPSVGAGRLSRWEDLLKRVRAEGFE